jgi:hypothetical protein
MMALTPAILGTCMHVLGTGEPGCVGRPVRLFFMLEARGLEGTEGHVLASEPTSVRRRGLEPEDTWQCQSPAQPGDEVQSRGTCGSTEAHLSREVRSEAIGRVPVYGCTPCYLY